MRLSISMGCFGIFWSFGSEKWAFWEIGIALGGGGSRAFGFDVTTKMTSQHKYAIVGLHSTLVVLSMNLTLSCSDMLG